mgnify:CR=1 FL=1
MSGWPAAPASEPAQCHFLDQVVGTLAQDEVGARPCRQDVLTQVPGIDVGPQPFGDRTGRIGGQLRIAVKEGLRIGEGGLPQAHEAVDIPGVDQVLVGIDIDREVEEIGDEGHFLAVARQVAGLKDVQPFQDKDVGAVHGDRLARHDVIIEMRIDRRGDMPAARLQVRQELQQRRPVVAFRKALLAVHEDADDTGREQHRRNGEEMVDGNIKSING